MRVDAGDFVLPVDKPEGPTSHDVVARARRALGTRRVGHTGTLDPFASGLLVLCVGRATRLAEYLTGLDKCYLATARLGVATDTLDLEGQIVAEDNGWADLGEAEVDAALRSFMGQNEQVPPQFSAKKVDGEAMHRKARRGEHVDLPARQVTIHEIELERLDLPAVHFRVRCSSGTYIRAIARDLGARLGVGAHLTRLRRTAVGPLGVEGSLSLDQLDDALAVASTRIGPAEAIGHLDTVEVDAETGARIRHGQRVRMPAGVASADDAGVGMGGTAGSTADPVAAPLVAVREGDALIAIARIDDGVIKPTKVFPE